MNISTLRYFVRVRNAIKQTFKQTYQNVMMDLRLVWSCRHLIIKPAIFSFIILYFLDLIRGIIPEVFMELNLKDEAYGAIVLLPAGVLHGILLSNAFNVIWEQNEKIKDAIREGDFKKFVSYFFRRIPRQMKTYILVLSVIIVYSVACCDFGSLKANYISTWISAFIITMAWFAAYEMDDPLSAIWSIRKFIPKEWQEKMRPYIIGSFQKGRVRICRDAEFTFVFKD